MLGQIASRSCEKNPVRCLTRQAPFLSLGRRRGTGGEVANEAVGPA
jgi:hypothetical protein